jgi:transcription antitermination factor NusG
MENWYVLYTKPRYEKKVTARLTELGMEAYCPMLTSKHQWSDRKKVISTPLISSVIFIHSNENDRGNVFQVHGAVRYLFWLGAPAIVKNAEIEKMQLWLQGEIMDAKVEKLQPGDTYNVKEGYFKGKEGIVQEVNKNRLQLVLVELGMKITITKE